MVGSTGPSSDDRLACEKCQGFYAVEVPEPGATPRVRCNTCGHIRELDAPPTPKLEEKGKWTVIGPDGKVMTFGSWEKLVESASQRPPPPGEKKVSASALLDITPPLPAPKLMLEDLESNPIIPVRPSTRPKSTPPPLWAPGKPPASENKDATPSEKKDAAPSGDAANALPSTKRTADAALAAAAAEEEAPLSLRDAIVEDEASPLSLRDVLPEDNETSPLSLKDVLPEDRESDASGHEVVSLDEVVLVTPETAGVETSAHPPARGALRTLPPSRTKGDVAPPPTITLDGESQAITKKVTPSAVKSAAGPKSKTDERKPSARPPAPAAKEEPAKRGWVIPALAAGGVIVLWRLMAAPTKPETPAPVAVTTPAEPTTTATVVETAPAPTVVPTADPTPAATPSAQPTAAEATAAVTPKTSTPKVADSDTTASAAKVEKTDKTTEKTEKTEKAPAAAEGTLSMSDLLDKAGSAKRSGDFATARELYEKVIKQSPGNVEANGGLGDVAKAQGDMSAAKASYEHALAASPTYVPAQLGLADIDWDQGNHPAAQKRYAQIVDQLGRRAPERARQRSAPPSE